MNALANELKFVLKGEVGFFPGLFEAGYLKIDNISFYYLFNFL